MKILLRFAHVVDWISERLGAISAAIVIATIVIGAVNPILRYVGREANIDLYGEFTRALTGTRVPQNQLIEIQWYLYAMMYLLGFPYILKHGVNVRVDFLYSRWSARRRALIDLAGTLVFLIPFCLLGLYVMLPPVLFSWGFISNAPPQDLFAFLGGLRNTGSIELSGDPGGLPRPYIKSFIIVGFTFLLLQAIAQAIKYLAVLTGHQEVVAEIVADENVGEKELQEIVAEVAERAPVVK